MKDIIISEQLAVAIAQLLGQMPAAQAARPLLALVEALEKSKDEVKENA